MFKELSTSPRVESRLVRLEWGAVLLAQHEKFIGENIKNT
jgi:hypothetical protein